MGSTRPLCCPRFSSCRDEKKAIFGCIHDIRDESDRTGLRAVVEIKKDYDPNKVLQKLYKYSDLQVTFGVNMVAIYRGQARADGPDRHAGRYSSSIKRT